MGELAATLGTGRAMSVAHCSRLGRDQIADQLGEDEMGEISVRLPDAGAVVGVSNPGALRAASSGAA